jgi:hypothetical protein
MNPATAAISLQKPNALLAILWGGTARGVLDITAAFIVYGYFGLKPIRLLQGIAGGLLGPRSLEGGLATAALGLLCHFVIAFSAAHGLLCAEPVCALPGGPRRALGRSVWGGRLLFHESHRRAAFGGEEISLFFQDDGHRSGHPHVLRRSPHLSLSAAILHSLSSRASVLRLSEIQAVLQSIAEKKCLLTTPSFLSSGTRLRSEQRGEPR